MRAVAYLVMASLGLSWGASALAKAEIQIFLNYRGVNRYDAKLVSDWDYVVTAAVLYFQANERPTNAACFKGDPQEAVELFEAMVQEMNRGRKKRIGHWAETFLDPDSGKLAIRVVEVLRDGRERPWFPRLRECTRWSTRSERLN